MKKIILLSFFFFILIAQYSFAEDYEYVLEINLSRVGQQILSELVALSVQRQAPTTFLEGNTITISLTDGSKILHEKGFFVDMEVHGIAVDENGTRVDHIKLDKMKVPLRLPYLLDADSIEIKTDGGSKTYSISSFICNNNGKCDNGENRKTCAADCPASSDGKCIPVIDNFCDPDCENGRDPDCLREQPKQNEPTPVEIEKKPEQPRETKKIEKPEAQTVKKSNKIYIYSLVLLVVLLLVLYFYKKMRE